MLMHVLFIALVVLFTYYIKVLLGTRTNNACTVTAVTVTISTHQGTVYLLVVEGEKEHTMKIIYRASSKSLQERIVHEQCLQIRIVRACVIMVYHSRQWYGAAGNIHSFMVYHRKPLL
jgi:hypothetical protein